MTTVIVKQRITLFRVITNLNQTKSGSKIIQRLSCSASNFAEVSSSGNDAPGRRLLNDINQTKDLSTMLSMLKDNEHILSQKVILTAIKKMSEIYQRDYNLGCKMNEEEYSKAFQSLSSIIDYFDTQNKKASENDRNVGTQAEKKDEVDSRTDLLQSIKKFKSLFRKRSKFEGLDKVLEEIFNTFIVNVKELTENDLRFIIGILRHHLENNSKKKAKKADFYNPQLVNTLASSITRRKFDLETYFILLRYMQELRHKNLTLLNHTLKIFLQTHSEGKLTDSNESLYGFYTLIEVMANTNSQSKKLKRMLDSMNFDLVIEKLPPEVLVTLSLNLAVMDFYSHDLMQKVFDNWEVNQKNNTQHWAYCKLWQKISVDPNYQGPKPTDRQISSFAKIHERPRSKTSILPTLSKVLGDQSLIKSNLISKLHHEIDHVVCYRNGGYPVPLNTSESTHIEDLPIPPGSILLLITYAKSQWFYRNTGEIMGNRDIYFKTLEALSPNWQIIKVPGNSWDDMPEEQKTTFIMEEIKSKLKAANFSDN